MWQEAVLSVDMNVIVHGNQSFANEPCRTANRRSANLANSELAAGLAE